MAIENVKVKKRSEKKRFFDPSATEGTPSAEGTAVEQKPTKIIFTDDGEQRSVPIAGDDPPVEGGKRKHTKGGSKGSSLLFNQDDGEVAKRWYEHFDSYNTPGEPIEMKDAEIAELRQVCRTAFEAECRIRLKDNPSDARWLQSAMEKGTSRDRASSGALLVQTNPFSNLQALETVIAMVKPSNKGHLDVVDVLTDLMVNSLMPSFRKLIRMPLRGADWKNVQKQDLARELRDRIYAHWHFEDQLRDLYFNFLTNISVILHSGQESSKCKTIVHASKLFAAIPEKEAFLLTMLVNKLGDPAKHVAVKALYHLQQVVSKHSAMAFVVTSETEKLLFRNNVSSMAQHYGLSFLSTISVYSDFATCQKMINVCFAFFKIFTEKGEINSRTMQSILACLRKAIGNMKRDVVLSDVVKPELLNVIYRMIHLADISIACQGLSLLIEVTEAKGAEQNRFYNTLYRKLLDPQLATVGPRISSILFYILHRAMQNDPVPERAQAFVKRLLQVAFYFPPSRVCATLIVINKVLRRRKQLMRDGQTAGGTATEGSVTRRQETVDEDDTEKTEKTMLDRRPNRYDAFCRSSEYAGANYTLKYELARYLCYFHPTVQKFAECILKNAAVSYYGDPLRDFSLSHFLERFAFKNPKKPKADTDASGAAIVHQRPLAVSQKKGDYVPTGSRALPVASLTKDQCTEDEQYIFQFLEQKRERMRRALEKKKERDKLKKGKGKDDDDSDEDDDGDEVDSDVDSLDDDEFDAYLDRLGVPGGQDDAANLDREELDFMNELERDMASGKKKGAGKTSASRKKGQAAQEEEDDGEDDGLDDWDEVGEDADEDDGDGDGGSEEDEFGAGDEEDDEFSDGGSVSLEENDESDGGEMDDDDEEPEEEDDDEPVQKKRKTSSAGKMSDRDFARKLKSTDMNSLFAAADDFSELLESNAAPSAGGGKRSKATKNPISGSHGTDMEVFNQDESSVKQLAWEQTRFSGNQRMKSGGKTRSMGKHYGGNRGGGRGGGMKHFQTRGGDRRGKGGGGKKFGGSGRPKSRK